MKQCAHQTFTKQASASSRGQIIIGTWMYPEVHGAGGLALAGLEDRQLRVFSDCHLL